MTSPTVSSCCVALLMGGTSNERSVSLSSGRAVTNALHNCGHEVIPIDVGPDITTTINALRQNTPDVVFNALHGSGGEDGHIQAVLDWLDLPYTHSGLLASAMAMDKAAMRLALRAAGLPVAEGRVITPDDLAAADPLSGCYVVKPLAEGSSVGVFILQPNDPQRISIARSWPHGPTLLVEEFVPGQELTVGVLRDTPLAVTEILPEKADGFYDFDAKYSAGGSRHIVPASLPDAVTNEALRLACAAHRALGCAGATRTDFRYDSTSNRLVILEINTQPGMTSTSLLPEQAAWRGMSYDALCHWMVQEALLQKGPDKKALRNYHLQPVTALLSIP